MDLKLAIPEQHKADIQTLCIFGHLYNAVLVRMLKNNTAE